MSTLTLFCAKDMQWTPLNTKHSDSLTFDVALIVLALIHKLWCDTAAYEVQGLDMLNIGDNRFIRNVAITVPGYFLSLSRDAGARMTTQEYDCELRRRAGSARSRLWRSQTLNLPTRDFLGSKPLKLGGSRFETPQIGCFMGSEFIMRVNEQCMEKPGIPLASRIPLSSWPSLSRHALV